MGELDAVAEEGEVLTRVRCFRFLEWICSMEF